MSRLRLRREGLAWHDVGGEVVLLDIDSSFYFVAKGSSSLLVSSLAEGASEEDLVELMLAHYEVDAETARTDIADFLRQLDDRNMLEHLD